MPNLEVVERSVPGAIVLDVIGELGVGAGTERLLGAVRKSLDGGNRLVIINMSGCTRVDSSGLGELVTCLITATRKGGSLRLASVPSPVRGLIKLTNLQNAFDIFETEEAARQAQS